MSKLDKENAVGDETSDKSGKKTGDLISMAILRRLKNDRDNLAIAEYLRWGEICRIRAEYRNDARCCIECNEILADWFGAHYIPEVRANDISLEEIDRHEQKIKVLAEKQANEWPGEALAYLIAHQYSDEWDLKGREIVKYIGTKFVMFLEEGDFSGARAYMIKMRQKAESRKRTEKLDEELKYRLAGFYSRCIRGIKVDALIKAFMEIGTTIKIERGDLKDIKDAELKDKVLIAALGMQLGNFREASPDVHQMTSKYLAKMGLDVEKK